MRADYNQIINKSYGMEIMKIYQIVCDYYNLPMAEVNKKCRLERLKTARQVAHFVTREVLGNIVPYAA